MTDSTEGENKNNRIPQLQNWTETQRIDHSEIEDWWTNIENGSIAEAVSALGLFAEVASKRPERVERYSTDLVELLADTRPVESGGTVAGHAMRVIAVLAETKPDIVEYDLDLLLTRIVDGSRLAKVYGCRALAHAEGLDESSTLAIADVLKRVVVETTDAHVGIAAATAITAIPCKYPKDRFADPYVQFRTDKLDSIILQKGDDVGEQFYEIMLTAALHDPEAFDHGPEASQLLEYLHNRYSLGRDISEQTYRLAQSRIG
ncbi:hypothetical protein [Natrinema altunense]|nr:hypothetical protein [Natrinema altunense]